MDFLITKEIKWSDINPLNHAIRNEFVSNLLNLTFGVIGKCGKRTLSISHGFVCGKLVDTVQKDLELRELIKKGLCLGFSYENYSVDEVLSFAKSLQSINIGTYLTPVGFYAVLNSTAIKLQSNNTWTVIDNR